MKLYLRELLHSLQTLRVVSQQMVWLTNQGLHCVCSCWVFWPSIHLVPSLGHLEYRTAPLTTLDMLEDSYRGLKKFQQVRNSVCWPFRIVTFWYKVLVRFVSFYCRIVNIEISSCKKMFYKIKAKIKQKNFFFAGPLSVWNTAVIPTLLLWLLNAMVVAGVLMKLFIFGEPVTGKNSDATTAYMRHSQQAEQDTQRVKFQ